MENLTKKIIVASVTLLIALSLFPVYAELSSVNTQKSYVTNETVSIATSRVGGGSLTNATGLLLVNRPTDWKTVDCPLTNVVYRNQSGVTLTLGTDYLVDLSSGTLKVQNVTALYKSASNNTYVDYTYCGQGYLTSSWSRTMLQNSVGLLALALLAISVASFYSVYQEVRE